MDLLAAILHQVRNQSLFVVGLRASGPEERSNAKPKVGRASPLVSPPGCCFTGAGISVESGIAPYRDPLTGI